MMSSKPSIVFEVALDPNLQSLGLQLFPHKLLTSKRGYEALGCCLVRYSDIYKEIKPSDILIGINNSSLLFSQHIDDNAQASFDKAIATIAQTPPPRKLRIFRLNRESIHADGYRSESLSAAEVNILFNGSFDGEKRSPRRSFETPPKPEPIFERSSPKPSKEEYIKMLSNQSRSAVEIERERIEERLAREKEEQLRKEQYVRMLTAKSGLKFSHPRDLATLKENMRRNVSPPKGRLQNGSGHGSVTVSSSSGYNNGSGSGSGGGSKGNSAFDEVRSTTPIRRSSLSMAAEMLRSRHSNHDSTVNTARSVGTGDGNGNNNSNNNDGDSDGTGVGMDGEEGLGVDVYTGNHIADDIATALSSEDSMSLEQSEIERITSADVDVSDAERMAALARIEEARKAEERRMRDEQLAQKAASEAVAARVWERKLAEMAAAKARREAQAEADTGAGKGDVGVSGAQNEIATPVSTAISELLHPHLSHSSHPTPAPSSSSSSASASSSMPSGVIPAARAKNVPVTFDNSSSSRNGGGNGYGSRSLTPPATSRSMQSQTLQSPVAYRIVTPRSPIGNSPRATATTIAGTTAWTTATLGGETPSFVPFSSAAPSEPASASASGSASAAPSESASASGSAPEASPNVRIYSRKSERPKEDNVNNIPINATPPRGAFQSPLVMRGSDNGSTSTSTSARTASSVPVLTPPEEQSKREIKREIMENFEEKSAYNNHNNNFGNNYNSNNYNGNNNNYQEQNLVAELEYNYNTNTNPDGYRRDPQPPEKSRGPRQPNQAPKGCGCVVS